MFTEIDPTAPIPEEDAPLGLSIDQPPVPMDAFSRPEYDGAPPSEESAPAEAAPAPKKMLRVDMGNGKYYTAESERELLQKLVDGKKEADRYIEELKALKAAAPPSTSINATVHPRIPTNDSDLPEKYDHQTYLDMLGNDPKKATRYINREIYGGDPAEMLQHAYTIANQVQEHMTAAEFRRLNPDYIPSDAAADVLTDIAAKHGLDPRNLPALEWCWTEAKRSGRLSAGQVNPDGEVEYEDINFASPAATGTVVPIARPNAPQRRGATAPPAPRGGGGNAQGTEPIDPYSIPLEDLRKAIESKGALRR